MDQGEPGKDLPILEQTREADPHETKSSKKIEATTERTPDTLTATTEMVNAPFEVTAPVALQEQFSPFEDVSPPPRWGAQGGGLGWGGGVGVLVLVCGGV